MSDERWMKQQPWYSTYVKMLQGVVEESKKTDGKTNFPGTPVNVSRIRQGYILRIRKMVTGCDHTLNFYFLTIGSVKIGHLGDVGC